MNKILCNSTMMGMSMLIACTFQSCVDDKYDLDKDIDMTITVGGNMLTIPSSSTANYSLSQILDLDDNSSIKPDANGDFVLRVDGDNTSSTFNIDEVRLNSISNSKYDATVNFPTIPAGINVPDGKLKIVIAEGATDETWNRGLAPFINKINLEQSNVDHAIVSLKEVETDVAMNFTLVFATTNYNGNMTIEKGFKIDFGKAFTVEVTDKRSNCSVKDGHVLEFNADQTVNASGFTLPIKISKISLGNQGLDSNHKFSFNSEIVTTGTLSISTSGIVPGTAPQLRISTTSSVLSAKIVSATGIVNPRIDINDIEFAINDIPDFLRENDNTLDISDPCVYLTVNNSSKATVYVEAVLSGFSQNALIKGSTVEIAGNDAITIKPGLNKICISRLGGKAGYTNVVVPNLSNIIKTIPDNIRIQCRAALAQQETVFELGHTYNFSIDNEVVAPLAFGPELKFTYSDSDDGWDEDLEDYNFNAIVINLEAESTIPLQMKPEVTPLFKQGCAQTVEVKVEGEIGGGTLSSPAKSKLTIELKGTGKNLEGLDGIEYVFHASSPTAGAALNEKQGIKFTNMSFAIKGGIIVDLN